jgi:hypothetical protein
MKKSPFVIVLILVVAICAGSFWHIGKSWSFREKLKDAVSMDYIGEYRDSTYGFTARYPNIFKQDSIGEGYARFGFHNETNIVMEYFAMPNTNLYSFDKGKTLIEKTNFAMKSRKNEDSFIISGQYHVNGNAVEGYCYYSKYVYRKRMWYVCRLIYDEKYRDCLQRLFKMVDKWKVWE